MSRQKVEHPDISSDVRTAALLRLQRRHRLDNHLAIYLIVNLAIWPVVGLAWQSWYPWSRLPPAA